MQLYLASTELVDGGQEQHADLLLLAETDQTFAFFFDDLIVGEEDGLDVIAVHQAVELGLVGDEIDFIVAYTHGDPSSETEKAFNLVG